MEVLQCRYLVLCYSTVSFHEGSGVVGSSGEEYVKGAWEQGSSSFPFPYYSLKWRDPSTFNKISNSPSPLSIIGNDPVWRRAVLLSPWLSSLSLVSRRFAPVLRCYFWASVMKLNATSRLARWQAVNFQPNSGWQTQQTMTSWLNLLKNIHYFDGTIMRIKRYSPDSV